MSGRRIAHGEARKLMGPFMDEEDLVQEGYIGLLRAAKRFDPDRGIRFSHLRAVVGARADDPRHRPHRAARCACPAAPSSRPATCARR
jgi:DNA-directed RNA polymerase specialized sigma24 family protein